MAQGKTAINSYIDTQVPKKSLFHVMLGNFPAKSKLYLKAICTQQLEFEDLSYCFRLPKEFVSEFKGQQIEN